MSRKNDVLKGADVFKPKPRPKALDKAVLQKSASRQADIANDLIEAKWSVRLPQQAVDEIERACFELRQRKIRTTRGALVALCVDKLMPQVLKGEFDSLLREGAYRPKAHRNL